MRERTDGKIEEVQSVTHYYPPKGGDGRIVTVVGEGYVTDEGDWDWGYHQQFELLEITGEDYAARPAKFNRDDLWTMIDNKRSEKNARRNHKTIPGEPR